MFTGVYETTIDGKGRIILPVRLRNWIAKGREIEGKKMWITRGIDKCIFIFTEEEWQNVMNRIQNKLSFIRHSDRKFLRHFVSYAFNTEFTKLGRLNIPQVLLDYADLKPNLKVIIAGAFLWIEVWNKELWQKNDEVKLDEDKLSILFENRE